MVRRLVVPVLILATLLALFGCVTYPMAPPVVRAPPPPAVIVDEPDSLFLIARWGVYFVPDISVDILFYNGLWYYQIRGTWYWSRSYLGPWIYIDLHRVPKVLRNLPPDYRSRYRHEYYRVPFGHWRQRQSEPPPQSSRKDPPYLYKTPRSGVYAYPGVPDEIYFYKDRWYSRFKGVWYWSWSHNGPWAYTDVDRLPGKMRDMPRQDYREDEDKFKKVPWKRGPEERGRGRGRGQDNDY